MEFTAESEHQEYFLRGVPPGIWKGSISAKVEPPASSAYMLEMWASDATIVFIDFDKDQYFPGEQLRISAIF